jgi:hypothetical protein
MKQHLLKSHVTIMDYAKRKMVYPTSVYSAINAGKIKPDIIGQSRIKMIDLKKYGAYKFSVHNPDKALLIKWFERSGKKKQPNPLKTGN